MCIVCVGGRPVASPSGRAVADAYSQLIDATWNVVGIAPSVLVRWTRKKRPPERSPPVANVWTSSTGLSVLSVRAPQPPSTAVELGSGGQERAASEKPTGAPAADVPSERP